MIGGDLKRLDFGISPFVKSTALGYLGGEIAVEARMRLMSRIVIRRLGRDAAAIVRSPPK